MKSGAVVTRSTSQYAINSGYNIFSTLEGAKLDQDSSMTVMRADISHDRAGQIGFTLDGVRRYMVYTPIQPDEWYLLTFVPASTINQKSDKILRSTLVICGLITFTYISVTM